MFGSVKIWVWDKTSCLDRKAVSGFCEMVVRSREWCSGQENGLSVKKKKKSSFRSKVVFWRKIMLCGTEMVIGSKYCVFRFCKTKTVCTWKIGFWVEKMKFSKFWSKNGISSNTGVWVKKWDLGKLKNIDVCVAAVVCCPKMLLGSLGEKWRFGQKMLLGWE